MCAIFRSQKVQKVIFLKKSQKVLKVLFFNKWQKFQKVPVRFLIKKSE
jgi:hypothetical protein